MNENTNGTRDGREIPKVAIIGAGALGGAVARGLAKRGWEVTASCPHPDRRPEVARDGARLISDNEEAASWGEVVMFAVKPHLTLGVVRELAPFVRGKLCVSLAAAVPLELLREAAPLARWARAMTSISAAMNATFTGLTTDDEACSANDFFLLSDIFGRLGQVASVEEGKLDALTALTGAAPALFLDLMEGAAMGGIQAGLPKDLAYRGAAAAVLGAARLAMDEDRAPSELRDAICTPGGMTIEGVAEIEASGARGAMMRAIVKTAEKGRVLAERIVAGLREGRN